MKRRKLMGGTALVTVLAVSLGMPLMASGAVGVAVPEYYGGSANTEPVSPLISGSGGVNCRGGDVCVEKIGDSAEVSWVIQTTPLVVSDDESQFSLGAVIAVPKVLEDLKLETIALPEPFEVTTETSTIESHAELISAPVPIVEQTAPLISAGEGNFAPGAVAPSLSTPAQDWKAYLYPDDTQLYDGISGALGASLSRFSPYSFLNNPIPGFVPDSQVQEVYDILDESWVEIARNLDTNRYFFERYVPYWLDALKSGDTDGLSYSPLLALHIVVAGGFSYDLVDREDLIFNLIDAVAAVEAEHPEVREPADPILGKEFRFRSPSDSFTVWRNALLSEEDQALIDSLYYVDGTRDVDEEAIKYPTQAEHERLAEQLDQLVADYAEYSREFSEKGEDAIVVDHADLYDYIYVPASEDAPGVSSFRLTGTVRVESDTTYLPVRVFSVPDRCLLEVCSPLDKYEAFGMFGDLPDYSLTDAELNADIAQLQTDKAKGVNVPGVFRATSAATDGRLGTMQCAPTSENYESWNVLGIDTAQAPQHNVGQYYADKYNLAWNPAANYLVSGYDANEDGCDQADVLVTICDEDKPTVPSTEPTKRPEVETPQSSAGTDKPAVNAANTPSATNANTPSATKLPNSGASIIGLSLSVVLLIACGVLLARNIRYDA